jgi:tellurite resistance protein TehA-like permease
MADGDKKEVSGWIFLGYYGLLYLIFMLILVVGYPLAKTYAEPIAAMIFPIAGHNSLLKNLIVDTLMYWSMVLGYTLLVQRSRLRF